MDLKEVGTFVERYIIWIALERFGRGCLSWNRTNWIKFAKGFEK